MRRWVRRAVTTGTGIAVTGATLAGWNRRTVARLSPTPAPVTEDVTVCVPARDEAALLPGLIADLRAQTGVARLRILGLDDASRDDTAERALRAMDGDPRCELLRRTTGPPPGWPGTVCSPTWCSARPPGAPGRPGTTRRWA